MIKLSHQQLLNVKPSWYWMVSDRAGEFDDALLRPMKSLDVVHAATEDYFSKQENNDPSGSDTQTSNNVREMLERLEDAGEDVDRIYEWGRALDSDMWSYAEFEGRPSASLWDNSIGWWRPDELAKLDRSGADVRDRLYASWNERVNKPAAALKQRVKLDRKGWQEDETRRSEWDNFLWDKWFKEFQYDPAMVAADGYRQMLFREWWRKIGPTITPEERSQMMRWHEEGSLARDKIGFLKPDDIGWIGDAMMTDAFPPFFDVVAKAK